MILRDFVVELGDFPTRVYTYYPKLPDHLILMISGFGWYLFRPPKSSNKHGKFTKYYEKWGPKCTLTTNLNIYNDVSPLYF